MGDVAGGDRARGETRATPDSDESEIKPEGVVLSGAELGESLCQKVEIRLMFTHGWDVDRPAVHRLKTVLKHGPVLFSENIFSHMNN